METLERYFNARVGGFLARTGMSPTTFGMRAVGDPNLMRQIAAGRSPSLRTADRVLGFIDRQEGDPGAARPPRRRRRRRRPGAAARRTRRSVAMTDRPRDKGANKPVRFIRASEILARVGVSRGTIYGWVAAGLFPRPIRLGPRVTAWIESEFEEWVDNRAANNPDAARGGAQPSPDREGTE